MLKRSKFEVTPILVGDKLVACTPFNAVVALDPGTGQELWRYDPEIKTDYRPANRFNCRGVAVWHGPAGAAGPCAQRILTATADLQLIALDLEDGKPCADFGQDGAVRIDPGKPLVWPGEFLFTSPPAVIGDLVILGSSIGDNQRVDEPRGIVRAFDVRTGGLRWYWDPAPERADDPDAASWGDGWRTTGAANVWAPIAIEELNPLGIASRTGTPTFGGPLATASGLVFIGAALDDYLRAFDAKTGAELWTGRLPFAGIATPTSYLWQGRQFVLIAAGGHGEAGAPAGDTLVAFALPRPGESGPSPWLRWLDLPGGRFELHAGMAGIVVLVLAVLWWRGRRGRHRRPDRRDGSEATTKYKILATNENSFEDGEGTTARLTAREADFSPHVRFLRITSAVAGLPSCRR